MTPRSRSGARKNALPKFPERPELIPKKPSGHPNEPKPIGPMNDFKGGGCKYIHGHPGSHPRTDWQTCGHPYARESTIYCEFHLDLAQPNRKAS